MKKLDTLWVCAAQFCCGAMFTIFALQPSLWAPIFLVGAVVIAAIQYKKLTTVLLLSLVLPASASADGLLPPVPREEVGGVRLVVLIHSPDEQMAFSDLAMVQGATKGTAVRWIGHYSTHGKHDLGMFCDGVMRDSAVAGDTLIIHTIGHGSAAGTIQNMGRRRSVMAEFAGAAARNKQKTLWWQLSCHAAAGLPDLETLPAEQQEHFMVFASSNAKEVSTSGRQGRIMGELFKSLRPGETTADDVRRHLKKSDGRGLFFSRRDVVFLN